MRIFNPRFKQVFLVTFILVSGCSGNKPATDESTVVEETAGESEVTSSEKWLGDNFALVLEQEDQNYSWDPSALDGSRWGGETIMFFSKEGDVFGTGIGFDVDTHFFNGSFKRISTSDQSETLTVSGESMVSIEGEGGTLNQTLTDQEIILQYVDGSVTHTGYNLLGSTSKVFIQNLSDEEMAKAKQSFSERFNLVN
ncbi:MAG: hypothetical protein R2820_00425 [Cyclobacteriaceae bacterium]